MSKTDLTAACKDARLHRVFERILPDGTRRKVVGHTRPREGDPLDDGVLTVFQTRNAKGEMNTDDGYLEIVSPTLRDFLHKALEGYPEPALVASPMRFRNPYHSLIHRHSRIEELALSFSGSREEKRHILHLLKFVLEDLREEIEEFDSLKGLSVDVAFDRLWTCFVPGEMVIKKDGVHYEECYEIIDIRYTPKIGDSVESQLFLVSARQCRYARGVLGYSRPTQWPLQHYPGTRSVSGLDWIPLKAREDWESFREAKIRDGRKWLRMVSESLYHHARYDSVSFTNDQVWVPWRKSRTMRHWRIEDYDEEHKEFKPIHVQGEIIIDQDAFMEAIPRRAFFLTSTLQDTQNEKGFFLKDEYALISPALVPGFALENKIWALFQVSEIREVDWSPDAYNDLQIDLRTKSILLNLVQSHQLARVRDANDIIPGKGNGLVFLLHGAPGTGKTFTAQAIAHFTRQPLYATTSGELHKNKALERNLREALRLSQRWRAIFLLDEADIFLAKRDMSSDMKRNETVTVFLQQIECTSTIIFLSTNRMSSFDPAMLSRIHLPIKYGTLSKSQRRAIWRARFGKQLPLDDVELDKLVEAGQQFSGRDIRNVVQMAMHLGSTGGAKNGEKWENISTYDEETKRARFQSVLDLVTIRQENLSAFTTDDADDMESS